MLTRKKPYLPYPDGTGAGSPYLPDDDEIAQPQDDQPQPDMSAMMQPKQYGGGVGALGDFIAESSKPDGGASDAFAQKGTAPFSTQVSESAASDEKPYLGTAGGGLTGAAVSTPNPTGTNNDEPDFGTTKPYMDTPQQWHENKGASPFQTTARNPNPALDDYYQRVDESERGGLTKNDIHKLGDKSDRQGSSPYLEQVKVLDEAISKKHDSLSGIKGVILSGLLPSYYHGEVQQLAQMRAEREAARRSAIYEGRPDETVSQYQAQNPDDPNQIVWWERKRSGDAQPQRYNGKLVVANTLSKAATKPSDLNVKKTITAQFQNPIGPTPGGQPLGGEGTHPEQIDVNEDPTGRQTFHPPGSAPDEEVVNPASVPPGKAGAAAKAPAPKIISRPDGTYQIGADGEIKKLPVPGTAKPTAKTEPGSPLSIKEGREVASAVASAVRAKDPSSKATDEEVEAAVLKKLGVSKDGEGRYIHSGGPQAPARGRVVQNFRIGDRVIPHELSKDGKSWVPMVK